MTSEINPSPIIKRQTYEVNQATRGLGNAYVAAAGSVFILTLSSDRLPWGPVPAALLFALT